MVVVFLYITSTEAGIGKSADVTFWRYRCSYNGRQYLAAGRAPQTQIRMTQPQKHSLEVAPVPGPAAGGAVVPSKVLLDHKPGARLIEKDLRVYCLQIDAAVQSLRRVELMAYPKFKNPYNGKMATMHRTHALFASEALLAKTTENPVQYEFSNLKVLAQPCTSEMQTLMDIVNNNFVAPGGRKFDRVLVNIYAGKQPGEQRDYISQHGDKGVEGDVVGVSAGGCRVFRINRMVPKLEPGVGLRSETLIDVVALPYHALVMEGDEFQKVLQHGVPSINLTPKNFADGIVPPGADDPRYSFTFRHHVEPTTKRKSAAGHKRGRDSPLSAAPDESA